MRSCATTPILQIHQKQIPLGVLLEGEFSSLYENRVTEEMEAGLREIGATYKSQSPPNRMIVVSDGDLILNPVVDPETMGIMPLGYNVFERRMYGNKDFIINSIEYLLNDAGMVEARGKEIELRPIDTVRATDNRTMWQLLNIGVPLLALALFAVVFTIIRRNKYTK
ncbi:MAG: hypothetical protein IPJ00_02545 [Saprospirales bacterium]|nr:hypothetical protein [Saprospirales bacterium]